MHDEELGVRSIHVTHTDLIYPAHGSESRHGQKNLYGTHALPARRAHKGPKLAKSTAPEGPRRPLAAFSKAKRLKFGTDLTEAAREGRLDPLVGPAPRRLEVSRSSNVRICNVRSNLVRSRCMVCMIRMYHIHADVPGDGPPPF